MSGRVRFGYALCGWCLSTAVEYIWAHNIAHVLLNVALAAVGVMFAEEEDR